MKVKRIIDLSQPIMNKDFKNPAFPETRVESFLSYKENGWMAEIITAATHVGTHIDAPAHRIEFGKTLIDFPIDRFQGEAVIIDLYHKAPGSEITLEDLYAYTGKINKDDIVLLCTGWGYLRNKFDSHIYVNESPWLGRDAARFLVEKKIKAVGIDHFSIGGAKPENVCVPHDILLNAEVLVFEEMFLPRDLLENERWFIAAFPVLLGNVSGSFARIVALEFD